MKHDYIRENLRNVKYDLTVDNKVQYNNVALFCGGQCCRKSLLRFFLMIMTDVSDRCICLVLLFSWRTFRADVFFQMQLSNNINSDVKSSHVKINTML